MPTILQKKAFKEVVNGSTIKSAMVKAGYSLKTSHRTNKLTRTKGWEELISRELPDGLLAKRHRELLNKREVFITKKKDGTQEVELIDQPDTQAVSKGLDMAYKIKGRYSEEIGGDTNIQVNIFGTDQLKKIAERTLQEKEHEV